MVDSRRRRSCSHKLVLRLVVLCLLAGIATSPQKTNNAFMVGRHPRRLGRWGPLRSRCTLKVSNEEPFFDGDAWSDDAVSELKIKDLEIGQELTGIVAGVMDFGVFVDVGAEKQGLVSLSGLSNTFVADVSEVVQLGDMVQCWVVAVDDDERLKLTMVDPTLAPTRDPGVMSRLKEVGQDEWLDADVKLVTDVGAHVGVFLPGGSEALPGFVHVSQMSEGFVEHPLDVVEGGQRIKVRFLGLREASADLSLSMRQYVAPFHRPEDQDPSCLVGVSPSKWFKGKVDHIQSFGLFVWLELPEQSAKLQGMVHVSQFRKGYVGDLEAEIDEGQEVRVRIIDVDTATGRISLSMLPLPNRAVGSE
eukprot:TRINITY_DN60846_c0_g1_i1.p1 TRINITY_DN60846_c0_g1~~TRINITY_DN60846_c0_g1_i1.p1  ORF type:complete len:361 (-),score=58.58 TRINITY_DN60846_c0_g1_i1:70-1152(-)